MMSGLRPSCLALLLLVQAGASAQVPGAAAAPDEGEEIAFGLNRDQFVRIIVCNSDAAIAAFKAGAAEAPAGLDPDQAFRRLQAVMITAGTVAMTDCLAREGIPIDAEHVQYCYPVRGFLPLEAKRLREQGAKPEPLMAAWGSFVSGDFEAGFMGRVVRDYYESDKDEFTAAAYNLAQCAKFPQSTIPAEPELLRAAAALGR